FRIGYGELAVRVDDLLLGLVDFLGAARGHVPGAGLARTYDPRVRCLRRRGADARELCLVCHYRRRRLAATVDRTDRYRRGTGRRGRSGGILLHAAGLSVV